MGDPSLRVGSVIVAERVSQLGVQQGAPNAQQILAAGGLYSNRGPRRLGVGSSWRNSRWRHLVPEAQPFGRDRERQVFLGFPYREPYKSRYGDAVASAALEAGWTATLPLGEQPQGMLMDQVTSMIAGSQRSVYEVGLENGNVSFELGFSVALRQPTAFMSDRDPAELPDILRSPWLRLYEDGEACVDAVAAFLGLESPPPLVSAPLGLGDPALVVVVGKGERAEALEESIRDSGRLVISRRPGSIRSLAEAVELAESCGVLVAVRPTGDSWEGRESTATLATTGAAFGLRREVILAAGLDERVPTDCEQLTVRGDHDTDLSANVLTQIGRAPEALPPSGTTRPRIAASLQRSLRTPMADALRRGGRALLSSEPGYGKTTLLDQVATELSCPTAWVTVEANAPLTQLVKQIVAAVGQHVPGFGWEAWVALRRSQQAARQVASRVSSSAAPQASQFAELLARDATGRDAILLVIDDVHKASEEARHLLARLARSGPPWLRIAFAGRDVPAEIRTAAASGLLPSWGAEELRFSSDETKEYLRESVSGLDDQRAALMYERTEGWPAALAVIRAWLAAHPDATIGTLREMARGDRQQVYRVFATDYFVELQEDLQHDLLSSSLPVRLDAAVARHLFRSRSGARLRALVEGPYFFTEEEAGTFRLHSLFREFLHQRWLEERGQDSLQAAQSDLARWYHEREDLISAYQIACEGEDWEAAVAVLEPLAPGLANRGDADFLKGLLDPIPPRRIREKRAVWESWVRALAKTGAANALAEAQALAAEAGPTVVDQAVADLVLIDLQHSLGRLSDHEMAAVCDEVAANVRDYDATLSLSARLLSLDARATRSADAAQWEHFLEEAQQLVSDAEAVDALTVAAGACATAADLASRIAQGRLSSDYYQLQMEIALGQSVSLATRMERANGILALQAEVLDLFKRAFRLAEAADSPVALAGVALRYSRYLTFSTGLSIIRSGNSEGATRQLEAATGFAMTAARMYQGLGIPRDIVIALNAAAEAASALGDRDHLDALTRESARIAEQYGYVDLAQVAMQIREQPSVWAQHQQAQTPMPYTKLTPQQREEVVDRVLSASGLGAADIERVRPHLEREVADRATLDEQREDVCQHLALLQDLRGPKVGPIFVELDWRVTCRKRGLTSVVSGAQAEPLLDDFTCEFCSECELRSPGVAGDEPGNTDEEIYAPLLRWLAPGA